MWVKFLSWKAREEEVWWSYDESPLITVSHRFEEKKLAKIQLLWWDGGPGQTKMQLAMYVCGDDDKNDKSGSASLLMSFTCLQLMQLSFASEMQAKQWRMQCNAKCNDVLKFILFSVPLHWRMEIANVT